ncbi:MAG: VCBS repeat-containing protein [Gemmataceae bacterium]|nr:VCBS repeat-containing protein [Gemmataceae bacterium]
MKRSRLVVIAIFMAALFGLALPRSHAYVEAPMSFGAIVAQSSHILLMRVEMVDRTNNIIVYRKLKDLKGVHPQVLIKHNIGRGGLRPNEWKPPMEWAEPGKIAAFFHNGGASETCIGNWWYQAYGGGEWWNHSHGEPFLSRSYSGPPEKLAALIPQMLEGKEVVVPCMVGTNLEDLHHRRAKIHRLKASLKLQDYNPKRDFVGWGGEDFRRLNGMAGFTHISSLTRVDPEAQAISVMDYDADGKPDLALVGGSRVALMQNNGDSLSENTLPGVVGARSAVWADYNSDGKPDLLLATPSGPRLFTNQGGSFRDDSQFLPGQPAWSLTAAAWLDYDADGKPDLLLANGYHGLRLYRNVGPQPPPPPATPTLGPWHYLGPLDNAGGRGFEATHPVETKVDLQGVHEGRDKEKIGWKQRNFSDGAVNDLRLFKPQHNVQSAVYLYRQIDVATPTDLPIRLGSDDTLSVWLNGQKILANNSYRAAAPDQDRVTLKLKAGTNHLLMKVCQGDGDWAFFFAADKVQAATPPILAFTDVSKSVGLGDGVAANVKHDSLTVSDVDNDGRPDFLYGNLLVMNRKTEKGVVFALAKDSGIAFASGKVSPVFGDYDSDGHPDLFVPQQGKGLLFKNDGQGRFADVTAKSGDLAQALGWATSAAWGDFDNDGHLDLAVGCLKASNRLFRNKGDGTFEDATVKVGLAQKIFNSQAVSFIDLNNDGNLDLVFNNEGQDAVVLLGSNTLAGKHIPLTMRVAGKDGVTGSRVRVLTKDGKHVATRDISGGDGRGGQQAPLARFTLEPGKYRVEVRYSTGQVRAKDITVGDLPLRAQIDEKTE